MSAKWPRFSGPGIGCHSCIEHRQWRDVVSFSPAAKLHTLDVTVTNEFICFDAYCLDLANECLWRGAETIKLRPKTFAVLDYLLARPGQLVTKEELLDTVWAGAFVSEAVLKVAIRQIREI